MIFLACTCFRFWFQMYLVSVNRKFEWVWWIWFEIHLDFLFVLHCYCDSFFSGKQFFFNWLGFKFFFWLGHKLGPAGPYGPQEKNPLSKRVGSGYGKTRPEPNPLPFLLNSLEPRWYLVFSLPIYHIYFAFVFLFYILIYLVTII